MAVQLRRSRALLRRGRADLPRPRHRRGGPDRAVAQHVVPLSGARARALRRRTCPPLARPGVTASAERHGCRPAARRGVRALRHLRGFPCPLGAKSDAETCGVDPALETGHARLETGIRVQQDRHRRRGSRGAPTSSPQAPEGPVRVTGWPLRPVSGRGELGGTPARLRRREASARAGQRLDQVGRNFMMHNNAHIVAVDLDRAQRRHLPEDAVGQRLVPGRR